MSSNKSKASESESTVSSTKENVKKLAEMIKGIRIAMMSTIDTDHVIRSRPMGTVDTEFDGNIWFFTREPSGKVASIEADQTVNLSYADVDRQRYVSIAGKANLVHDKAKMEELWNPLMKAWFPKGLEDPEICLLKVQAESAEIWDSPPGMIVRLVGFVEALATGKSYDEIHGKNQNQKMDLAKH